MRLRTLAIIAGITAFAAVLRFWHIGARDVWTDEAISVSIARLPWHEFRRVITNREANAAFYEVLLKLWTSVFGTSEIAVRSMSAIAGTATVATVFFVGRRLLGERIGLTAAALLAVNAFHVRYSQEARGYALVALLVTLSTLAFLRVREQTRVSHIAVYVLTATLAVYSHMFAVFVVAAQFLSAWFDAAFARTRALLALAIVAVLSSPLALFAKTKDVGQIAWIEPPSLKGIAAAIWSLSGHGGISLALLLVASVVIGAIVLVAREKNRVVRASLFGWAILPFLCSLLVSLLKPIFLARYLIVALPALVLLAAVTFAFTATSTLARAARILVFIAILALSLGATVAYYRAPFDPPPQHWRNLARRVAEDASPDDAVIFYHPYMRMPFEYSRQQLGLSVQAAVIFPATADAGMMIAPIQQMNRERLLSSSNVHPARRVWLIRSSPPDATSETLQQLLRKQFATERTINYGAGVDLFTYSGATSTP